MKFNVHNVKYIVNKEKGVVVAYLDKDATLAFKTKNVRELLKGASDRMTYRICDKYYDVYKEPFTFKAVAKLHPKDEWDEELGKRIALDKLQLKLKKYIIAGLEKMDKKMKNIHDLIVDKTMSEKEGIEYLSKKIESYK